MATNRPSFKHIADRFVMSNNTSAVSNVTQEVAPTSSSITSTLTTSKPTSPLSTTSTQTPTATSNVAPTTVPVVTPAPQPPPSPQSPPPQPQPQPDSTSTSNLLAAPITSSTPSPSPQEQQPHTTEGNAPAPTENTSAPAPPQETTAKVTQDITKTTLVPSFVTVTLKPTSSGEPSVVTVIQTFTHAGNSASGSATSSSSSTLSTAESHSVSSGDSSGGLTGGGKIAVAVVTPIVAVTLIVLAFLFLFRRRKQRKHAEELRRKEVEEYGYNPNQDPTFPVIGSINGNYHQEVREESAGYRGWGTTAPDAGRKTSTTLSGNDYPAAGGIGLAFSEGESPTYGTISDTKSDNALITERNISAIEQDHLSNLVPAVARNKVGDINREASNASSSYSAANRSDESGEVIGYYNQSNIPKDYGSEIPHDPTVGLAEMAAHPVIRDVQARRNTRIESPSHFPQQSSGISQNF
ncbi:putative transmembrane alpha-helix domain-containing protein [Golovinomyces cichoracearum]|uniref:Putative transmembrane alpha-helix domain-containing protein n=1 Tax=Golovinomyces cichoracearum TaxID=62708 RepID=A0A420IR52_9PEZI|nr:putative transmembrane alpha-helix domain-containing protein [Golovinomyces cichoracearum]